MKLRLIGTNHRLAPLAIREQLAASVPDGPTAAAELTREGWAKEAVIVSTCNRFEVLFVESENGSTPVEEAMARWANRKAPALAPHLFQLEGADAARHLFRVVSALDSMVLGEPQILGQVKQAYRGAQETGAVGPLLHKAMQKSFSVAKRVRTETAVGEATLSVAGAAVDLTTRIFEDLRKHSVLLLGAGEMGRLALKGFAARGAGELWVANRTLARASELAEEEGAFVLPWERRTEFLARASVVLAATGATEPILTRAQVASALRARRGRPLVLVDISVPRNLDGAIHSLDGVYLYDIDDLGRSVEGNREKREAEAKKAEEIVEDEAAGFARVLTQVHVGPVIKALHGRSREAVEQEVERTMHGLNGVLSSLGPDEQGKVRGALERMGMALTKRFLHHPVAAVKKLGASGELDGLTLVAQLMGVQQPMLSVHEGEPAGGGEPDHDAEGEARSGQGERG